QRIPDCAAACVCHSADPVAVRRELQRREYRFPVLSNASHFQNAVAPPVLLPRATGRNFRIRAPASPDEIAVHDQCRSRSPAFGIDRKSVSTRFSASPYHAPCSVAFKTRVTAADNLAQLAASASISRLPFLVSS